MATVDKHIADIVKNNDGYYPGDPRVSRIVEYDTPEGGTAYGIEYEHERGRYAESVWVRNPRVYWDAKQKKAPR